MIVNGKLHPRPFSWALFKWRRLWNTKFYDRGEHPGTWFERTILKPFMGHELCGLEECPYLERWVYDPGWFSLRLHRWHGSDDQRALHDHPWSFLTLCLRGSYTDISDEGEDTLRPGSLRWRDASHQHTVKVLEPGKTWTLVLTGPVFRRWGFHKDGKFIRRDRYFAVHGHHPCDPGGQPVRKRPDGSRIT